MLGSCDIERLRQRDVQMRSSSCILVVCLLLFQNLVEFKVLLEGVESFKPPC